MNFQEILTFIIVAAAGVFVVVKFIRQFTHGDEPVKCSKCELYKAVNTKETHHKG